MKQHVVETNNGLKATINVPETVEEYDQLAKKPGMCLEDATDNVIYRGVLPQFWAALATALNAEYGIPFKMKDHPTKKEADGKTAVQVRNMTKSDGGESNPQYVDRVAAEKEVEPTEFQSIVDRLCTDGWDEDESEVINGQAVVKKVRHKLEFDPSVQVRQVKVPTPGKQDMLDAAEFLKDEAVTQKVVGKLGKALGREVVLAPVLTEGSPEELAANATLRQTTLALAIRDYGHVLAKQAKQGLKG